LLTTGTTGRMASPVTLTAPIAVPLAGIHIVPVVSIVFQE
jgi:hypothetical protein